MWRPSGRQKDFTLCLHKLEVSGEVFSREGTHATYSEDHSVCPDWTEAGTGRSGDTKTRRRMMVP